MAIKVHDWKAESETLDLEGIEERLSHYSQLKNGKLEQRRREALDQVRSLMQKSGLTVDDIVEVHQPQKKSGSTGKKMAPKYRNPNNPDEVWSGQGIAPKWMPAKEHKDQWVDFLIKPE